MKVEDKPMMKVSHTFVSDAETSRVFEESWERRLHILLVNRVQILLINNLNLICGALVSCTEFCFFYKLEQKQAFASLIWIYGSATLFIYCLAVRILL